MLKIYGSMRTSAGRNIWLLEELGVPYEMVDLNMKEKEHKSESYLKLNPNGKVPTLVDEDFVLFESYAINQYLAEKHQPELLGKTLEERALVNQWTFWGLNHVQKYFETIMYFAMFNSGTAEGVEKAKTDVMPFLAILNNHLAGKDYVVGNAFTLADISLGTIVNLAMSMQYDFSNYANILKWAEKIKARPAVAKIMAK